MIQSEPRTGSTQDVVAELRARQAFVMVSHVKPDGDTLGAACRRISRPTRCGCSAT
jgi:nanoRNase/pAp phosphatase (c-di-AMP/oligoRNAs hydrolase)